jgi:hypothetical protein
MHHATPPPATVSQLADSAPTEFAIELHPDMASSISVAVAIKLKHCNSGLRFIFDVIRASFPDTQFFRLRNNGQTVGLMTSLITMLLAKTSPIVCSRRLRNAFL